MRAVCIVQARMGSTRLPGKVLLPLGGHTVLWHVLTRCKEIRGIDDVVLAVPDEKRSDQLIAEASSIGVHTIKGPEHDVLARYHRAALAYDAEIIMRVTADCPLINPNVCWEVLKLRYRDKSDYASNVYPSRTWPQGMDCEVFTFDALQQAHENATEPYDREHVCPWVQRNCSVSSLPGPGEGMRLTLDTPEDYIRLQRIFGDKRAA